MATYYVDAATGNDSDTGLTEALAFATIQKAMDTVAAGDEVWIKGGTDYNEAVTRSTSGTSGSPIQVSGYTSTIGDGGLATLFNNASLTSAINGIRSYYIFRNFVFDSYASHGVDFTAGLYRFENCTFTNNGGEGLNVVSETMLVDCEFSNNTENGAFNTDYFLATGCAFTNNGNRGMRSTAIGGATHNCVFAGNTASNLTSSLNAVTNCTFDGKNVSTFGISNFESSILENCIFYDCDVGAKDTGSSILAILRNCIFNSNTTDTLNYLTSGETDGVILAVPNFEDEAAGDYRLAESSAARNAGADARGTSGSGMDIGAYQSKDTPTRIVLVS